MMGEVVKHGVKVGWYDVEVLNDILIISNLQTKKVFYYHNDF